MHGSWDACAARSYQRRDAHRAPKGRWHRSASGTRKLLVPMARLALGNDLAVGDVECREQGRRAVAFIIMREAISMAEAHRQHRLSSLQRLDLALLIDTKNHGVFGRAEI